MGRRRGGRGGVTGGAAPAPKEPPGEPEEEAPTSDGPRSTPSAAAAAAIASATCCWVGRGPILLVTVRNRSVWSMTYGGSSELLHCHSGSLRSSQTATRQQPRSPPTDRIRCYSACKRPQQQNQRPGLWLLRYLKGGRAGKYVRHVATRYGPGEGGRGLASHSLHGKEGPVAGLFRSVTSVRLLQFSLLRTFAGAEAAGTTTATEAGAAEAGAAEAVRSVTVSIHTIRVVYIELTRGQR